MAAATTFHGYPKAPAEVKLLIMGFAVAELEKRPRVVEIEWDNDHKNWFAPIDNSESSLSLLTASVESRTLMLEKWMPLVATKNYQQYLENSDVSGDLTKKPSIAIMHFNPGIDTLYIIDTKFTQFLNAPMKSLRSIDVLKNLKYLAIDSHILPKSCRYHQALSKFLNLEHITVVCGERPYFMREVDDRYMDSINFRQPSGGCRTARKLLAIGMIQAKSFAKPKKEYEGYNYGPAKIIEADLMVIYRGNHRVMTGEDFMEFDELLPHYYDAMHLRAAPA